ncbi:FecR domain-containing protein [Fulvivirgaceae bacterium BMA12]|uniref:FecR domain-containing protein n=1 Tax=Agaribacillus aureus TaxID=3051825 RepID=A0ABT8L0H4_9BACT|nr:FecR domain-containing protein [Fulvivirgaceae bacterium BMA12]
MINPSDLAEKFFKGLCTESEAQAFLTWYFSENATGKLKKEIDKQWSDAGEFKEWDEKAVFEKVQRFKKENKLFVSHKAEEEAKQRRIKHIKKKKVKKYWWYAAACFVILATAFVAVRVFPDSHAEKEVASVPQFIIKSNPAGQKSTIYLGDGSEIVLNSASTIKYPPKFATQDRIIYLEGEAFFKVAKDSLRPFTVLVNDTKVTALGTSFNIRAFKEEGKTSIALVTGKVKVDDLQGDNAQSFYLKPGEGIAYANEERKLTKINIDPDEVVAWKYGILNFNQEPVQQVVRELERWYDVNIMLSPAIEGNFTGRFRNQTLKAVLEGLSYSFALTYSINGKSVMLEPKNK